MLLVYHISTVLLVLLYLSTSHGLHQRPLSTVYMPLRSSHWLRSYIHTRFLIIKDHELYESLGKVKIGESSLQDVEDNGREVQAKAIR